jgi:hypothetical protein
VLSENDKSGIGSRKVLVMPCKNSSVVPCKNKVYSARKIDSPVVHLECVIVRYNVLYLERLGPISI